MATKPKKNSSNKGEIAMIFSNLLAKDGPFTSLNMDMKVIPALLEWIGSDPMRLRELLNYVHERGMIHGANRIVSKVQEMSMECQFRTSPNGADYGHFINDFLTDDGPTERAKRAINGS